MNTVIQQSHNTAQLRVLPSTLEDRRAIYDILLHSDIFGLSDAECVDQMFGEAFTRPGDDNYRFLSCWEGTELIGFACYGREALTQGTWDIFWACVSGAARRKGAGRALFTEVLQRAAQEHARLIVLYTSSTEKYAAARGLYDSLDFTRTAVIPEYYAQGDDLYIYTKRVTRKE